MWDGNGGFEVTEAGQQKGLLVMGKGQMKLCSL